MSYGYERVEHGNTFHQSVSNVGKLGAYYTDKDHCERIGWLIDWPEGEVCVIEPSVGDGSAVAEVTKGFPEREQLHIYGVEMNIDTYNKLKASEDRNVDYVINADFLTGVKISQRAFSFCFANPPYGEADNDYRYEQKFEEKLFGYLKRGSLLAYVIPYYLLQDEKFIKSFFGRYEPCVVYRFDDAEYAKFKQIVILAYRRASIGYLKDTLADWYESVDAIEKIPYLPKKHEEVTEKFRVSISKDEQIQYFSTLVFDSDSFRMALSGSSLLQRVGDKACVPQYRAVAAGNPPLPLTKENAYMLGVCGAGAGFAGSEEEHTLHLQRGVVTTVTTGRYESKDSGDGGKIIETTTSSSAMNIIDGDFNFTRLK